MMTYENALDYLKKAAERGSRPGLSRITELLGRMDNPQNKTRIIHVAGTNGKGSFGAMLTSVLKNAGYKVGGFSSPAITSVTDSFRIDCEEISAEAFADIIGDIAPVCESMDDKPTEFEILTAAAFSMFVRNSCDVAVVECGMGGELDSTNVIESPLLSVITNVQLDHCSFLGSTIAEIAEHKSGIIKQGRPVFFGEISGEAYEVIRKKAEEKSAELFTADYSDILYSWESYYGASGITFSYKGMKIELPLLGTYQYTNAVNVLNCIEILRKNGLDIPYSSVCEGLSRTKWHGRFEVLRTNPYVIFDGSHNPEGIRCAADSIRRYFGDTKVALIIGVMADKNYGLYADMLDGLIDCVFAVTPDNPRALDSSVLAEAFSHSGIPARAFKELACGVHEAYSYAKEKNIPLIALGSLYMYREFKEALEKQ